MNYLKKNYVKLAVLLLILLVYTTFCLKVYTRFIVRSDEYVVNSEINEKETDNLTQGDEITQLVNGFQGNIQTVAVKYSDYKVVDSLPGEIALEITDKESGRLLSKVICDTTTISASPYINFILSEALHIDEPTDLLFNIKINKFNSSNILKFDFCNIENKDEVSINGEKTGQSLAMSLIMESRYDGLSKISLISFTLIGFLIIGVYYLVFLRNKETKTEFIYLICAGILGIIFLLLIPEFTTPDEEKHIMTAYGVSNMITSDEYKDYVALRENDKDQKVLNHMFDRQRYDEYVYGLCHDYGNGSEMTETSWKMLETQKYLYIFPAIGIAIGKILKFGTIPTYFLGAVLNYLLFMLMAFVAIRKIPFAKVGMMILCLLPMTLQQASSYSYDAPILGMSLVIIALSLKIAVEEKISKRDIIELIIVSIFFLPVKGFVYAPILLFVAFPIKRLFKENKKLFKILVCGIAAAFVIALVSKIVTPQQGGSTSMNGFVEWANAPGYTISYLLHNPGTCLNIFWDTIIGNATFYIGTLLGSNLGWLCISIPWSVLMPILIILLISSVKNEDDTYNFSVKSKLIFGIMILCSVAGIMGAMLFDWTPLGRTIIEGVQGRYFLPLLLPLLFFLRSDYIKVNKKILNICIFAMVIMQPFLIFHIVAGI